jgi:hypothetical protein
MTPEVMITQEKHTAVLNLMALVREKMAMGTIQLPKNNIKHNSHQMTKLMAV